MFEHEARDVIARSVGRGVWDIDIDNYEESGSAMPRYARSAADLAIDNLRAAGFAIVPVDDARLAGLAAEMQASNSRQIGMVITAGHYDQCATRIKQAIGTEVMDE